MSEQILDTPNGVQPIEQPVEGVQANSANAEPQVPSTFDIPGVGELTVDEIKEFKQGYMRQSDYTKKTQSIASQRKEHEDALEIYNYLKQNPTIATQLYNGEQVSDGFLGSKMKPKEYEDLADKIASMEIDNHIRELKSRYTDFDEVAVLNRASELGVADLEFVYKGMQGETVDRTALEKQIREQVMRDIQKNGIATETIISTNDPIANVSSGLTPQQIAIAEKMGLTQQEYASGLS